MNVAPRERTIAWTDPHALADRVRSLDGLAALRALAAGELPPPPILVLLNMRLVEVDDGLAVFEAEPAEYHFNPLGVVHGGFALTLFDSALGCSVQTKLPAGVGYGTTDVQVRLVRPITLATGTVRCEARAIHVGRTTAIADARLVDRAGKLLGTGTTGCAIFGTAS